MRKLPKDVLKMASGLILPSGLAGHRRPLCNIALTIAVYQTAPTGRTWLRLLQARGASNVSEGFAI